MKSEERPQFEQALRADNPLEALRAELSALLDEGASREALLRDLESDRDVVRSEGRGDDEDVLLEAMDLLAGWASPHVKL